MFPPLLLREMMSAYLLNFMWNLCFYLAWTHWDFFFFKIGPNYPTCPERGRVVRYKIHKPDPSWKVYNWPFIETILIHGQLPTLRKTGARYHGRKLCAVVWFQWRHLLLHINDLQGLNSIHMVIEALILCHELTMSKA